MSNNPRLLFIFLRIQVIIIIKKYKPDQIEDSIYQIQGYGSMLSGKKYPLEITIDNSQNQIKEIKQKNLDNQLETIYSQ